MNPWGMLYECLHSALIDVLNRKFEKIQPELGLPQSVMKWAPPAGTDLTRLSSQIAPCKLISPKGDRGGGVFCLSTEGTIPSTLGQEVLTLALTEFAKRCERQPGFTDLAFSFDAARLHSGFPEWPLDRPASRVVWTPVRLDQGKGGTIRLLLGLALGS